MVVSELRPTTTWLLSTLIDASITPTANHPTTNRNKQKQTSKMTNNPQQTPPINQKSSKKFIQNIDGISILDYHVMLPWITKWESHWISKVETVVTPIVFVYIVQFYGGVFLPWNENRTDIHYYASLSDPILPHIEAFDLSIPLFICAYGTVISYLYHARNKPNLVFEFFQTYMLVICARMIALYLTPLEAPINTVPLFDPLANVGNEPLVRDLFFSGHTSTVFTAFFSCRNSTPLWKISFLIIGFSTAMMVIFQKAHYVVDVYTAPFFVYACHRITFNLRTTANVAHLDRSPEIRPIESSSYRKS